MHSERLLHRLRVRTVPQADQAAACLDLFGLQVIGEDFHSRQVTSALQTRPLRSVTFNQKCQMDWEDQRLVTAKWLTSPKRRSKSTPPTVQRLWPRQDSAQKAE